MGVRARIRRTGSSACFFLWLKGNTNHLLVHPGLRGYFFGGDALSARGHGMEDAGFEQGAERTHAGHLFSSVSLIRAAGQGMYILKIGKEHIDRATDGLQQARGLDHQVVAGSVIIV